MEIFQVLEKYIHMYFLTTVCSKIQLKWILKIIMQGALPNSKIEVAVDEYENNIASIRGVEQSKTTHLVVASILYNRHSLWRRLLWQWRVYDANKAYTQIASDVFTLSMYFTRFDGYWEQ